MERKRTIAVPFLVFFFVTKCLNWTHLGAERDTAKSAIGNTDRGQHPALNRQGERNSSRKTQFRYTDDAREFASFKGELKKLLYW